MNLRTRVELLRAAMDGLSPMFASFDGLPRYFCPVAVGVRDGVVRVFTWQYDGGSRTGQIPDWRCFAVARLEELRLHNGVWRGGDPIKGERQDCVTEIWAAVSREHTTADLSEFWNGD